jgi:hypothetical protein
MFLHSRLGFFDFAVVLGLPRARAVNFHMFSKRIEMATKHVFSFDVPAEQMSSFDRWCDETSKPFSENHSEEVFLLELVH